MVLDIIEAKLFKEPEQSIKLSIPKYRCNLILKLRLLTLSMFLKFQHQNLCFIIFYLVLKVLILPWFITLCLYQISPLTIGRFLEDPHSIKRCRNKYINSFVNDCYNRGPHYY